MGAIVGVLRAGMVHIDDAADGSRLYNKGCSGTNQPGGGLLLDPIEALYLLTSDRLEVRDSAGRSLAMGELLAVTGGATAGAARKEVEYLVYRELRERGFVVRVSRGTFHFLLYARGERPPRGSVSAGVLVASERDPIDSERLVALAATLRGAAALPAAYIAIVDEEGDVTFYNVDEPEPKGSVAPLPSPPPAVGTLLTDRVVVSEASAVERLQAQGWYGRALAGEVVLSLLEALYLQQEGWLSVHLPRSPRSLGRKALYERAAARQPDLALRLAAYRALRERGLVIKTGFKYGTHFRGYDDDPEHCHAQYLIHVLRHDERLEWSAISRAVRLAHGVRKEMLFLRVRPRSLQWVRLRRMRP